MGDVRLLVCGVGNALNGDEKVGTAAIEDLGTERLGSGVVLLDCGANPGGCEKRIVGYAPRAAVVIAALDTGRRPGAVEVLPSAAAKKMAAEIGDVRLQFFMGFLEGFVRDMRFVAVQPRTTEPGRTMSAECVNAVRRVREEVMRMAAGR